MYYLCSENKGADQLSCNGEADMRLCFSGIAYAKIRFSHDEAHTVYVYFDFLCIIAGAKMIGVNPKINNMITGYEAAKHDLIMISDSGIKSRL